MKPGSSQGVLTGQALMLISPLSLSNSSHSFFMETFHSLPSVQFRDFPIPSPPELSAS